jgi:hypothetical protein
LASGAEQFVPPPPTAASFSALVMIESRAVSFTSTTPVSNGNTIARGFLRRKHAATNAATSTHRTFDEEPLR